MSQNISVGGTKEIRREDRDKHHHSGGAVTGAGGGAGGGGGKYSAFYISKLRNEEDPGISQ